MTQPIDPNSSDLERAKKCITDTFPVLEWGSYESLISRFSLELAAVRREVYEHSAQIADRHKDHSVGTCAVLIAVEIRAQSNQA